MADLLLLSQMATNEIDHTSTRASANQLNTRRNSHLNNDLNWDLPNSNTARNTGIDGMDNPLGGRGRNAEPDNTYNLDNPSTSTESPQKP